MKLSLVLCGLLLLLVAATSAGPVVKRQAVDDLLPLNENDDDDRTDRDKRKIGVIKLGVGNGIINFVFGKLDAFLDAKTQALEVLDESNKAKNAAFEIDNTKSSTSEFINTFLAQKAKASSQGIGPLFNAGSTFFTSAKQGLTGAFVSKFAPLSSLSGGLAGGLSGGSGGSPYDGSSGGGGGGGGSNSGSFLTGILGSLSGSSGNGGGLSGGFGNGGSTDGNGVDDLDADFPGVTTDSSPGLGGSFGGGVGAKI